VPVWIEMRSLANFGLSRVPPRYARAVAMLLIFSFAFFILVTYVSSFRFFPPGEGRDSQHVLAALNLPVSHTSYPPPRAYDLVKPVIANVSVASMRTALETFTSFKTRHSPTRVRRVWRNAVLGAYWGIGVDWAGESTLASITAEGGTLSAEHSTTHILGLI
jgi:hypothetical protein